MSLFDEASILITPNAVKAGKLYSIKPTDGSGDLSVVRATTATRVNSAGLIETVSANIPRLDYSNGSCPSILVEPQRTNVLTYSNEFSNAAWSKNTGAILANNATSPEGITNASKLVGVALTTQQWIYRLNAPIVSGSQYTFSIFAKKGEYNFIQLRNLNNIDANTVFDLNTGTVYITSTGTAKIENYGNGWYRCSVTATATLTGNSHIYVNLSTNGTGQQSFLGNGTSGVFIYGAQHEAGANATSYIPTLASAVTRNADVISKTGISSLIGQTEGAFFIDFEKTNNDNVALGGYFRMDINNGTTSNRILFGFDLNQINATVISGGSIQASITTTGTRTQQRIKAVFVYKLNDFALYVNGVLIGSDNSGLLPTSMDRFNWGVNQTTNTSTSAIINKQLFFKTRLTDQQCINITTL
jgi:hypothetical protein